MIVYTIDRAAKDLILIQYDHLQTGADNFRDKFFEGLTEEVRKELGVGDAYYYDDAIWLHALRFWYTRRQRDKIAQLVMKLR